MDFNQNKDKQNTEFQDSYSSHTPPIENGSNSEYNKKGDEIIQEPKTSRKSDDPMYQQQQERDTTDTDPYYQTSNQQSFQAQGQPQNSFEQNNEYVSGKTSKQSEPYVTYQQWQEQKGSAANFNSIYGTGKQKKKKNNKPIKIIVGILVCAMLFGGGVLIGTNHSGSSDSGTNNGTSQTSSEKKSTASGTTSLSIVSSEDKDSLSSSKIYAKVSPSVVSVVCTSLTDSTESSGSGVIMSKDGYIITNQHVVADADKITVVLSDNTQYQATPIGSDEQTDLAVIKIEPDKTLTPAEFGDSDELQVGDIAYAIGSPGGVELQNTFTSGMISAINRDITVNDRVMTLIQTDASINPGNSGGALINNKGQVIGITNAKLMNNMSTTYEGLGFAIPISSVQDVVQELITNGHVVGRPAIGISGYNISEDTAKNNDVPQGVLVEAVDTRSDAYTQGIKKGDIVVGVNGKDVTSMDEINKIKEEYKAGDSITLNIYRSGKDIDVKIKLMDENDLSTQTASDDSTNDQQNDNSGSYYYQFPFSNFFGN